MSAMSLTQNTLCFPWKRLCIINWLARAPSASFERFDSLSTNDISLPVRPPILPTALPTPCAAALRPELADDVTRERPCDAFDCTLERVSFDFAAVVEAVSFAASVVEACRLVVWRATKRVCRSSDRWDATADIEMQSPGTHHLELRLEQDGDYVDLKL